MKNQVDQKPVPMESISWEDLNVYEFRIYPDCLWVMTNADENEFKRAVELVGKSHERQDPMNIEVALWEMGFAAAACAKPVKIKAFMF